MTASNTTGTAETEPRSGAQELLGRRTTGGANTDIADISVNSEGPGEMVMNALQTDVVTFAQTDDGGIGVDIGASDTTAAAPSADTEPIGRPVAVQGRLTRAIASITAADDDDPVEEEPWRLLRPTGIAGAVNSVAETDTETVAPAGIDSAATSFEGDSFLHREKLPPSGGWRRLTWRMSGGRIVPSPGASEARERAFAQRIQTRITACQRVAVASAKGGVGKTTATVLLGTAMAMHRLDRVIAIDANPDAGSLGWRIDRETESTLTDLLRHAARIERYSDVRAFTSQSQSRLEVLASGLDPAVSQALVEEDYATVIDVLDHFYSVILCDLGTGLLDSATQGLLKMAGQVVVVASPSIDSGRVANFTLDFIERRHPHKAANAVVILNNVRNDGLVDVAAMKRHFGRRVRAVVTVPYDRHIANGATPTWALLKPQTQDAYLEAAAAVADGFLA